MLVGKGQHIRGFLAKYPLWGLPRQSNESMNDYDAALVPRFNDHRLSMLFWPFNRTQQVGVLQSYLLKPSVLQGTEMNFS